jgi:hypothetical protein
MAWNDYGAVTIAGDPIPAMDHDSQAPMEAADRIEALESALLALVRDVGAVCDDLELQPAIYQALALLGDTGGGEE